MSTPREPETPQTEAGRRRESDRLIDHYRSEVGRRIGFWGIHRSLAVALGELFESEFPAIRAAIEREAAAAPGAALRELRDEIEAHRAMSSFVLDKAVYQHVLDRIDQRLGATPDPRAEPEK